MDTIDYYKTLGVDRNASEAGTAAGGIGGGHVGHVGIVGTRTVVS